MQVSTTIGNSISQGGGGDFISLDLSDLANGMDLEHLKIIAASNSMAMPEGGASCCCGDTYCCCCTCCCCL